MKLKLVVALVLLVLAGAPAGYAQQAGMVSLFDFGSSVRALGMGNAFAGLADDEQALLYNPAGLALLDQLRAHAMFASHLGNSTLGSLVGALPSFGAGLQFYGVGGLEQRDAQDTVLGPLHYGQFALLAAGALRLGPFIGVPSLSNLGLGLRVKFLSVNTLAAGSGTTFAFDPSVLWEVGNLRLGPLSLQALRLGAALDNLGPGIGYGSGHKESLGLGARLGVSARVQDAVTTSFEFNSADGLHLGGEYVFPVALGTLAVRAGLQTLNGFTVNVGLGYRYQKLFRIDYAFSSHARLGGSHMLALSLAYNVGRLF